LNIHNTLFTYDGKHEWPPNEQLLMAFNWLEIEAIKKGQLKKANYDIKEHYLNDFKRAKTIEKNNQPLMAAAHYVRIVNTYSSFFNIDTVRQELQNIQQHKDYSNTLKARNKAFEKEDILNALLLDRFDKDYKNPKKTSLKWWEKQFEKLKTQATKANSQILKMHERVQFNLFVKAYTISKRDKTTMSQQQHLFCKTLISLLRSA